MLPRRNSDMHDPGGGEKPAARKLFRSGQETRHNNIHDNKEVSG